MKGEFLCKINIIIGRREENAIFHLWKLSKIRTKILEYREEDQRAI